MELWEASDLEYKPRGRDTREHMENEMKSTPDLFLGLFEDERLIGSVIGSFDGRRGWINRLAVHPDYRGEGFGKKLVGEIEKRLREKGARIIAVLVYEDNDSSLEVFKRSGYLVFEGVTYLSKREDNDV